MNALIKKPAVYAWVILMLLTLLAWWFSIGSDYSSSAAYQYVTPMLFLIAFFKVRLVIIHFMEIGSAPVILRVLMEAWVILVCLIMLGLFWLA